MADYLSLWIKCVLQASQPWISTRHIDRGAVWFSEINDQLQEVSVGVVCLTKENKNKPWILFECGALAKGLSTNKVCTFLIDLECQDITDPLAQFNHTYPDEQGMRDLVKTLNAAMGDRALDDSVLNTVFETYWPQFESSFSRILHDNPPDEEVPPLTERDLLSEILAITRSNSKRLSAVERQSTLTTTESTIGTIPSSVERAVNLAVDMVFLGHQDTEIFEAILSPGVSPLTAKRIIEKARKTHSGSMDPLV